MYRGFNLKIPYEFNNSQFLETGRQILEDTNKNVKKTLEEYLLNSSVSLDGNKIIQDWFPEINSHVFLSHSHQDKEKAMMIAGILYKKFNIKTFIDSTVWGNSNDLLRKIDDQYCQHTNNQSYDYDKRNYSTSHVHLMLSSALNKMIDKSECLFFLNSPNSISTSSEINKKTKSPWIFSEISTSKIIRKKTPNRKKRETRLFSTESMKSLNENDQNKLTVEYELELSHLMELNALDFNKWISIPSSSPEEALDRLYSQHTINLKFLI